MRIGRAEDLIQRERSFSRKNPIANTNEQNKEKK
jgi:hypothetical protein